MPDAVPWPGPDPDELAPSVPIGADGTDELFRTMGEFLDMDLTPPEYLIDGILPVGGVAIVGAKPDVGKSTLMRTTAMAVVMGDSWLGRNCKQGPVVLCQFEEIPAFARDHLVQMGADRGTPIYPFFDPCPDEFVPRLGDWCQRHRPALVIVDTLSEVARGKDLLDHRDANQVLIPIVTVARTTGAAIMLTHHNKKGESSDPADDLLGSTAIRAKMDHTLAITQIGERRTIRTVTKRYGDPMQPTYLEIDPVTGRVEAAGDVKEKAGETMEAEIRAVLADGPCNGEELESRVHGRGKTIRHLRDSMVERGEITRTKEGQAFIYSSSVPSPS